MRIDIITLFPEMCEASLGDSILGRARRRGHLQICCHQLRDHAYDRHQCVDDRPFGGGKGMLLMAEPMADAIDSVIDETGSRPHIIYMSPQGQVLTQQKARELAEKDHLLLLCGHYEGLDERIIDTYVDEQISCGDYVLTGGELPAMILTDCVARMLPGVLAEDVCFEDESHFDGLLEYPQYTRPAVWRGQAVPEVLLSGNHGKIADWRRVQSLQRTQKARPDMYAEVELTKKDRKLLAALAAEEAAGDIK